MRTETVPQAIERLSTKTAGRVLLVQLGGKPSAKARGVIEDALQPALGAEGTQMLLTTGMFVQMAFPGVDEDVQAHNDAIDALGAFAETHAKSDLEAFLFAEGTLQRHVRCAGRSGPPSVKYGQLIAA